MKILHIIPSYTPAHRYGGPIVSVHTLNRWLVKLGVKVTVFTTNIDGVQTLNVPLGQEVLIDGVSVFYFPITFRHWFYSATMHAALRHHLKDFDVVHITSVFLSASTLGAFYAKKFQKPYLISPRGILMQEPLQKKSAWVKKMYCALVEKGNLSGASTIHFTSQMEREEYVAAGFPLKKSVVIPNCFDLETGEEGTGTGSFRERYHIGSQKKIVLFLGRVSWKKGLDTLMPAFTEVARRIPQAVLVIAGQDDEGYRKEIDVSDSRVIFTGMLLGAEKAAAYRDADVFVLPSYSESFGMAVVEAMASKLPVVVTKGVGISEVIEKFGAGIVVEKETGKMADAIVRLLCQPQLASEMGEKGRALVQREFACGTIAETFVREYEAIIKQYRQTAGSISRF